MGLERHISFQHWKCLIKLWNAGAGPSQSPAFNSYWFSVRWLKRTKTRINWKLNCRPEITRLAEWQLRWPSPASLWIFSILALLCVDYPRHNDHIHICPPVFRGIMLRHTGSTWIEMHPHVKLTLKVFLSEKLQTFSRIGRGWWAGACMNNMGHIFWDIIYQKWQSHSDTVPVVRHKGASVRVGMYLVNVRNNHKIREQLNNSDVKH